MVSTLDIIKELKRLFQREFENAGFYLINLNEDYKKPAFLFSYINERTKDNNYYLKTKVLDIQIIYFAKVKTNGKEDENDRFEAMEKLDNILGALNLNVKDRNLKFKYRYGEAGGHLTIELDFEFADNKPILKLTNENIEMIQKIFINEEGY